MNQDLSPPKGLFPSKKLKIKSVSKRGIVAFSFGGVLLVAIAVAAIFSQSGMSLGKDNSSLAATERPRPATEPEELTKGKEKAVAERAEGKSFVQSGGVSSPSKSLDPDRAREEAEFQREIRRYQHQQYMQKLARMDAAAIAPLSEVGASEGFSDQGQPSLGGGGSGESFARESSRQIPDGMGSEFDSKTDPNLQARKQNFYGREQDSAYLTSRKMNPISENEIKQGTVIPGILVTGINSDLPGQIVGQVSQNVYDTSTGNTLLIPQGTKIIGTYDSVIAIGQDSAMMVWTRLIFPDASSIDLKGMGGTDQSGYSGARDLVDNHYLRIFGSAAMVSLIGAGYQLSQPKVSSDHLTAQEIIQAQVGQQMAQVSGEIARRNMAIQPTIKIRPGYRFNVMINKDMILEPWNEQLAP